MCWGSTVRWNRVWSLTLGGKGLHLGRKVCEDTGHTSQMLEELSKCISHEIFGSTRGGTMLGCAGCSFNSAFHAHVVDALTTVLQDDINHLLRKARTHFRTMNPLLAFVASYAVITNSLGTSATAIYLSGVGTTGAFQSASTSTTCLPAVTGLLSWRHCVSVQHSVYMTLHAQFSSKCMRAHTTHTEQAQGKLGWG